MCNNNIYTYCWFFLNFSIFVEYVQKILTWKELKTPTKCFAVEGKTLAVVCDV